MCLSKRSSALLFACALSVSGCLERGLHRDQVADPIAAPATNASQGTERERVIHVTMRVRVASVLEGTRAVRAAIEQEHGYVASATEEGSLATLDARVPAARVASFRAAMSNLGETVYATEHATDVTMQHRDLSAQLTSARTEEARLLALMNTSAANLADVLAVERELARVSNSIAQLEASERDLSAHVAMAQVNITLDQESPGFAEDPLAAIGEAASTGVHAARNLAVGSTIALATMGPSLALMLLVLYALWRTVKFIGTRIAAR